MSGHNRWSKIKHKKEATDSKKSKLWTKVIKELTISARLGGGDVTANPRLRAAVDKARTVNMPNDTIDRAIKKGTGDLDGITYEEFLASYAKESMINRLNTVEEVAALAVLLASDAGGGITGALLNVDGGTAPW